MGTCYMLVDEEGRNALDIGKCYALWWVASGKTNTSQARDGAGHPVTTAMIEESAQGWLMSNPERYVGTDMAELAEHQDVAFSSRMAGRIGRWQREIAGGRDLRIYEEGAGPCGGDKGLSSADGTPQPLVSGRSEGGPVRLRDEVSEPTGAVDLDL